MNILNACEYTGFKLASFGPDEDVCECCNSSYKQLYSKLIDKISYKSEYFCTECLISKAVEKEIHQSY